MKGESLYEVWAEELEKLGEEPHRWERLPDFEQAAWNALAKFVEGLATIAMKVGP